MTNTELPRQLIEDAIDFANVSAEIRDDYSGRGMYGSQCFGITFDSGSDINQFFAALGMVVQQQQDYDEPDADEQLAFDLARRSATDSMGLGTIVYFPGYQLAD